MNLHQQKLHRLLDIVMPDTCVMCRRIVTSHQPHLLCEHCVSALPINQMACRSCALPLQLTDVSQCGSCQTAPLTEDLITVPLLYEGVASHLLKRFKFERGWREGSCLAHLLAQHLRPRYTSTAWPEVIVPVPISRITRWRRGFNQAHYIAAHVGHELGLPVSSLGLRKRHTPAQRTLSRAARRDLSRSVFDVSQPIAAKHVALVDDVLTTGSTMRALRRLLFEQGAEQVDIWCVCRAVLS